MVYMPSGTRPRRYRDINRVIMGLDEFSKPDWKSNHSPYGKTESMKMIRRKKSQGKIFYLKQQTNKQKATPRLKL